MPPDPGTHAPTAAAPEVAVVLVTKNSQRYLREVLEAVRAQDTRRSVEVVAVDSGSQDDTVAILRANGVRLAQIAPDEFNHGLTRNLAAGLASASVCYLVFLTHDATPAAGWLEALVSAVEASPEVAGAFSRHLPRPTCPPPLARLLGEEWEQSGTPQRVVKKITDPSDYERRRSYYAWFSNTSSCIRREVWQAMPFARVDFAEDAEWADRVLRAGYTLIYEPASCVIHSHDYGLVDQFAQNMDHARGMKRIFAEGVYTDLPSVPARFLYFLRTTVRDIRFILRQPLPLWRKAYWLVYSPAWHAASFLGTWVGRHYERLPARLIRRISKQERLRAAGSR
jgi:rhamnosyltransferase